MCYDVASATRLALKYAKHRNDDLEVINKLQLELDLWIKAHQSYYYVSGFAHPNLLAFTNADPLKPVALRWGLIPSWVKLKKMAQEISNQTLNARSETMFEKPSFKNSANNKRCLIYLDAFYEHHHFNGKTYPFHISMKDESPLVLGGLWDEWVDTETGEVISSCSIVTTIGNKRMAQIHNNPKLSEARMPLIIPKGLQEKWLEEKDSKKVMELIKPFPDELLRSHTVHRLKGKTALGNVAEVENEYKYTELTSI